jgi:frataxin-like iron-binding protein CyaY
MFKNFIVYNIHKNMPSKKFFITLPFEDKDIAKAKGAKWSKEDKSWYVDDSENELLDDYQTIYLNVKYEDKDKAKSLGAKYDASLKQWFCSRNNTECLKLFNN